MQTHAIKDLSNTFCPHCSAGPLDGVTAARVGGENPGEIIYPEHGSPTICAYCGEILLYQVNDGVYTFMKLDEKSFIELRSDSELWKLLNDLSEKFKEKAKVKPHVNPSKRY